LDSGGKAQLAAEAAIAHRAHDVVILDISALTTIADYFVIASGTSTLHTGAVADAVLKSLSELDIAPSHTEGRRDERWILLDYGDVIVHVFRQDEREYYGLERLWGDARRVAAAAPGANLD